ncbi:MAG: hypothetical protein ACI38Z_04360 [Parafannyhessea sp.]|uniref:hypothetical protein n=1 Tax=Parafannyhessea sp. TaxID=2847324 RepID=UPI003F087BAA
MATTRTYLDYLDEKIDISPANSQEELDAAELIGSLMEEHGLDVQMQEFDAPSQGDLAHNVLYIVMFVGILLAGFLSTWAGVLGLILVAVSFVFLALAYAGHDVLANLGPRGRSQNVIGVHRASGPLVMKGNRPIVIVAHYDSPNEDLLSHPGISAYQPMIRRATFVCSVIVPLCALFQLLVFLPEGFRRIFWIVGILASLPLLLVGVSAIYQRFAPCTTGASDNKSSLAAMLGVMDMVAPHDDAAKRYVALHPRRQEQMAYDQPAPEDGADQYYAAAAAEGQQPEGMAPQEAPAGYEEGQFFSPEGAPANGAATDMPYAEQGAQEQYAQPQEYDAAQQYAPEQGQYYEPYESGTEAPAYDGEGQATPAGEGAEQYGEKGEAPYEEQPQTAPVDETIVRESAVPVEREQASTEQPQGDGHPASKAAGLAGFFRKAADSVTERVQGFRKGNAERSNAVSTAAGEAGAPSASERGFAEDGFATSGQQATGNREDEPTAGAAGTNRGDVTGAHDVRTRSGQRLEDIIPEVGENPFDGNVRRGPDFVGSLNILPTDCEIVYDNPPRPKPDLTKLPQVPEIPDFEKEYEEKYAHLYEQGAEAAPQEERGYEPAEHVATDGSQPQDVVYEPYDPAASVDETNVNPYMVQEHPTVDYIHYVTYDEQYPIVEEYEVLEEPKPEPTPEPKHGHMAPAAQSEDNSAAQAPTETEIPAEPQEPEVPAQQTDDSEDAAAAAAAEALWGTQPSQQAEAPAAEPTDDAQADADARKSKLIDLPEIAPTTAAPNQDEAQSAAGSTEPEGTPQDQGSTNGPEDYYVPVDDEPVAPYYEDEPANEDEPATEPAPEAREAAPVEASAADATNAGASDGDMRDMAYAPAEDEATAASEEAWETISSNGAPVEDAAESERSGEKRPGFFSGLRAKLASAFGKGGKNERSSFSPEGTQQNESLDSTMDMPVLDMNEYEPASSWDDEPTEPAPAVGDSDEAAAPSDETEEEATPAPEQPAEPTEPTAGEEPAPAEGVESEPQQAEPEYAEPKSEPEPEPDYIESDAASYPDAYEEAPEEQPEDEAPTVDVTEEPEAAAQPEPAAQPAPAAEPDWEPTPAEEAPLQEPAEEPAPVEPSAPAVEPRAPKYNYFVDDTPIVEDYEVIGDSGEKNVPPSQEDNGYRDASDGDAADATTKLGTVDDYASDTYEELESTAHMRPLKRTATLRDEYTDRVEPMPRVGEEASPIEPLYDDAEQPVPDNDQAVEPEAPTEEPEPMPEAESEEVTPREEPASQTAEPAPDASDQVEPEPEATGDQDATDPAAEAMSHLNFAPNEEVPESELESKDASGLDAPVDDPDAARQEKVPEPRPIDDPNWGRSEYRPEASSIARRAVLFDLPDPSESSSDPFASGPLDGAKKAANAGRTPVGAGAERAESGPVGTREPIGLVKGAQPMQNEAMRFSVDRNRKKAPTHHKVKLPNLFGGRPKKLDPSEGQESMSEWLGVEEDYDAKKDGRKIGDWDHFNEPDEGEGEKNQRKGSWKGGATTRAGFRVVEGDAPDGANPAQGDVPADGQYEDQPYDQQPQQDADAPAEAEGYDLYGTPTEQPEAAGQNWDDPAYQQEAYQQGAYQQNGQMPPEPTQEDLRQAVLGMSDDELLAHDIYFVALGASAKDHAGMKHFLADHRRDIRGAFLVNLDSIGAGDLVFLTHEGRTNTRRADRRMGRMLLNIAKDLHIPLGRAKHDWGETDATLAMQNSVRAATLMGVGPGGVPALSATSEDVPENVNPAQVVDVTDLIAELIRRS